MTKFANPVIVSTLVLVVLLSACGKQAGAPRAAVAPLASTAGPVPAAGKATVLGALNDADWYIVITAHDNREKPLVIRAESKPACDQDVAEFSLQAVDPASVAEPPKAWCVLGKDVRAKLGA